MAHSERLPTAFGVVNVHSPYRKLKDKLAKNSVQVKILNFFKKSTQVIRILGFVFCEINFQEGPEILLSVQQQL